MDNVSFEFKSAGIQPKCAEKIAKLATWMNDNQPAVISLDGHGTDKYNQALSERRVNTVRDALMKAGVARDKIQTGAFGEMRLKCQEATEACWQSDRRVEVLIGTAK